MLHSLPCSPERNVLKVAEQENGRSKVCTQNYEELG